MRAWLEATGQGRFERLLSVFRLRWRSWAQARRGQKDAREVLPESSKNFTFGCPWFRPVILALPGPLIPRVIFVLEGWTSASLNLSDLPCPALPCLPVFARLCMSRRCAQPATRYMCQNPPSSARPVPRGNHDTPSRGAISEAAGLH